MKPPVSLEKLVYLDGEKAVLYRSKRMNPGLGRNFEAMDPLEWLARMVDHIPDPGKHRTLRYGVYSNRARGAGEPKEPGEETAPKRKRCTASWARLIHKVYEVDPLVCPRCGGEMRGLHHPTRLDQAHPRSSPKAREGLSSTHARPATGRLPRLRSAPPE